MFNDCEWLWLDHDSIFSRLWVRALNFKYTFACLHMPAPFLSMPAWSGFQGWLCLKCTTDYVNIKIWTGHLWVCSVLVHMWSWVLSMLCICRCLIGFLSVRYGGLSALTGFRSISSYLWFRVNVCLGFRYTCCFTDIWHNIDLIFELTAYANWWGHRTTKLPYLQQLALRTYPHTYQQGSATWNNTSTGWFTLDKPFKCEMSYK